jgi:hypothetical protein
VVASPILYGCFPDRLRARVVEAASIEGVTVSKWVRGGGPERLGAAEAVERERVALLSEARRFLAAHRDGGDEVSIVERLAGFLELVDGRISRAEQRGRQPALAEIAAGSLEALAPDGEVIELAPYRLRADRDLPVILETPPPTRRGFLRLSLVEQRARELLAAAPAPEPLPRAGLLGPEVASELFAEATRWPGARRVFCQAHGITPCWPSSAAGSTQALPLAIPRCGDRRARSRRSWAAWHIRRRCTHGRASPTRS